MPPAKKAQEAAPTEEDDEAWLRSLTVAAGRLEEMGFVQVIKDTVSDEVAVVATPLLLDLLLEVYRDHEPQSPEDGVECLADSIALQAIDRYGTLEPEDLDCLLTVAVNAAQVEDQHERLMAEAKGA